jgi:hypothetical protein
LLAKVFNHVVALVFTVHKHVDVGLLLEANRRKETGCRNPRGSGPIPVTDLAINFVERRRGICVLSASVDLLGTGGPRQAIGGACISAAFVSRVTAHFQSKGSVPIQGKFSPICSTGCRMFENSQIS